ncbi:hypothetical protein PR048_002979 [Dryococelus australis]|uniref:Uncharacterized protein n=1 Tax=Dryococelus australis TaxID=614101 RepID=A0ABQ9ILP7_9NEOP|nr:hypothetical protein PR048_002979 [Dryococelus australis]
MKEARDWGWQKGSLGLIPITMLQPPAHDSIMNGACDNVCQQDQHEEDEALGEHDLLQQMVDEDLDQPPTIVEFLSDPEEPDYLLLTTAEEEPEIEKLSAEKTNKMKKHLRNARNMRDTLL